MPNDDERFDDDRFDGEELGTAAEATPGTNEATTVTGGEDAATVRPGGGDRCGVPGRDDLEGDVGADVTGATGDVSPDAGLDEDVPGASPQPREPDPGASGTCPEHSRWAVLTMVLEAVAVTVADRRGLLFLAPGAG